jgi:ribosome biogenesis protein SSF1/2
MPRRGRHRKKTRTHTLPNDSAASSSLLSQDELKTPRSLVIRRGKVESELIDLVSDLRKLMRPYTAVNFKEDAKNKKITMTHYANSLTSTMGITHILCLSQKKSHVHLRIGRTPTGPTLTFRVKRFTLSKHLRAVQRRPIDSTRAYESPPVVVTNNFGDVSADPHVKLMRITFQNMFPAIHVGSVKLGDLKRVVLFNFIRREVKDNGDGTAVSNNNNDEEKDLEDEEIEIRHYAIRAKPVGIDRKVRRLIEAKIPNLSKLDDISDYITGRTASGEEANVNSGMMSDSENEDETTHVVLPSTSGKKKKGVTSQHQQKSALKLVELGPRLRMKLVKVERGMAQGDVMYHAYVKKSAEEIRELKERKEGEIALKVSVFYFTKCQCHCCCVFMIVSNNLTKLW